MVNKTVNIYRPQTKFGARQCFHSCLSAHRVCLWVQGVYLPLGLGIAHLLDTHTLWTHTPPWTGTSPLATHTPRTPRQTHTPGHPLHGQQAGGTHPTGMLSSFSCSVLFWGNYQCGSSIKIHFWHIYIINVSENTFGCRVCLVDRAKMFVPQCRPLINSIYFFLIQALHRKLQKTSQISEVFDCLLKHILPDESSRTTFWQRSIDFLWA